MGLSTEDWYRTGETAAIGGHYDPPKKGSWQFRAYDRGFKHGRIVRGAAPNPDAIAQACARMQNPVRVLTGALEDAKKALRTGAQTVIVFQLRLRHADSTLHWPHAAREHFSKLIDDFARENQIARRERLFRALSRMVKRRGLTS